MKKDIYGCKPNILLIVNKKDNIKATEALYNSNIKKKYTHSSRTTDYVDYWCKVNTGVFEIYTICADRFMRRYRDCPLSDYKKFYWKNLISVLRELNKRGIEHEIIYIRNYEDL